MKKSILSVVVLLFFSVLTSGYSFAYTSNVSASPLPPQINQINPADYLKNKVLQNVNMPGYQGIGTSVPTLGGLKGLLPNTDTTFSFNDVTGSLKAVGVLAINLFLVVIQTVAGILKALLPFLSK